MKIDDIGIMFFDFQPASEGETKSNYTWSYKNIKFDLDKLLIIKSYILNNNINTLYLNTNIDETINKLLSEQSINVLVPIKKNNTINGFLAIGNKENDIFNDC